MIEVRRLSWRKGIPLPPLLKSDDVLTGRDSSRLRKGETLSEGA